VGLGSARTLAAMAEFNVHSGLITGCHNALTAIAE
jgi:hypothetical protein